jgi:sugar (pentulose or hexulose) kinase
LSGQEATIVIDIGKTMAKASLWQADGTRIGQLFRPNAHNGDALDTAGITDWLVAALTQFASRARVTSIIPIAHGAAAAIINDGKLVVSPIDYEASVPSDVRAKYDAVRGSFLETGSPALPGGLNLGVQLFQVAPLPQGAQILLWPQYWSWLLSGVAACEVTSLGCHTDLWTPARRSFSTLVDQMGLAQHFPPLRRAGDVLGPISHDWAVRTGLPTDTQIHCGIHDSNAALVAARGFSEIEGQEATIVSTGTWFIALRALEAGGAPIALPETRDCLVNVDAEGQPVPSARFMGGREIEVLGSRIDQAEDQQAMLDAVPALLASGAMILPGFVPGCGPFQDRSGAWINKPVDLSQQRAAIALYVALVTDASLDLIDAKARLLIEGRFAGCALFTRGVARLRRDTVVFAASEAADVSLGALRLINPAIRPTSPLERVEPLSEDLDTYRATWRTRGGLI